MSVLQLRICIISFIIFSLFIFLPKGSGQIGYWFYENSSIGQSIHFNPGSFSEIQKKMKNDPAAKSKVPTPVKMEIELHLGSMSLNYYNGIGYFQNNSLFKLTFGLSKIRVPQLADSGPGYNPFDPTDHSYYAYNMILESDDHERKSLYGQVTFTGPSVFIKKGRLGLGLITGFENYLGLKDIADDMMFEKYRLYHNGQRLVVPPWMFGAQSFAYFGLHISNEWSQSAKKFRIGGNVKYLAGLAACEYIQKSTVEEYRFVENNDVVVSNMNADYFYSQDLMVESPEIGIKGHGVGVDLGVAYQINTKSRHFKGFDFNVAIKNLGVIRYGEERNSGTLIINTPIPIDYGRFGDAKSMKSFVDTAITIVTQTPENEHIFTKKRHSVLLPLLNMGIGVQLRDYASVALYTSSSLGRFRLMPMTYVICPQLMLKPINIKVPLTYDVLSGFKMGVGLHTRFIAIGTNDLRSLFARYQFREGSFYTSISIRLQ